MTTVQQHQHIKQDLSFMPVAEAGTVPPLALRPCWSTCGATWWPESRSCRCCGVEPALLSGDFCAPCSVQIKAECDAAWAELEAMDEADLAAVFHITPEGDGALRAAS